MGNAIEIIRQGEDLPFTFELAVDDSSQWICTINVKINNDDTALISRVVALDTSNSNGKASWSGFLTSTETTALNEALYRLTAVLANATTDEQTQIPKRFQVSGSWA